MKFTAKDVEKMLEQNKPKKVDTLVRKPQEPVRVKLPTKAEQESVKEINAGDRLKSGVSAIGHGMIGSYANTAGTLTEKAQQNALTKVTSDKKFNSNPRDKRNGQPIKQQYSAKDIERITSNVNNFDNFSFADKQLQIAQEQTNKTKQGLGKAGQFVADLGIGGGQLVGDMAIGALTGTGVLPSLAIRGFGQGAYEARQSGADLNQQLDYGALSAGKEVLIEKLVGGIPFAKKLKANGIADDAVQSIGIKLAQKISKSPKLAKPIIYAMNMGGEGVEEMISEALDPALKRLTYDPNADWATIEEIAYSGLLGAGISGFMGGGVVGNNELTFNISEAYNPTEKVQFNPKEFKANIPYNDTRKPTVADIIKQNPIQETKKPTVAEIIKQNPVQEKKLTVQEIVKQNPIEETVKANNIDGINQSTINENIQGEQTFNDDIKTAQNANKGFTEQINKLPIQNVENVSNIQTQPTNKRRSVPEYVQRIEEVGVSKSKTDKPQGIYTSPSHIKSPHEDLGGDKYEWKTNPKAKVLELETKTFKTNRGNVGESAGVAAARQFLGDNEVLRMMQSSKKDLINELNNKYPNVEWNKYYDQQEMVEGYAGLLARENGYDAIWAVDEDENFDEYVALTENAMKDKEKELPQVKNEQSIEEVQNVAQNANKVATEEIKTEQPKKEVKLPTKAEQQKSGVIQDEHSKAYRRKDSKTHDTLDRLSKSVGVKIKFSPTIKHDADGLYNPQTNTIELSLNNQNPIMTVAKHELTHLMQVKAPKLYEQYKNYIIGRMKKKGIYQTEYDNLVKAYESYNLPYNKDLLDDEIVSNASAALFADRETIAEMINYNPTMAEKIHAFIKDIINKIKKVDSEYSLRELQKAEKLWSEMLNSAIKSNTNTEMNKDTKYSIKENPYDETDIDPFEDSDSFDEQQDRRINWLTNQIKDVKAVKLISRRKNQYALLTPSIKGSKYQITTFDNNDTPIMDLQRNSIEEVVKELDDLGYVYPEEVKYSLKDSNGKQLTKEQAEFFKDSKVRDEQGNLLVVYHGTANKNFYTFDIDKTNPYSLYGKGFYFTDDEGIAKEYTEKDQFEVDEFVPGYFETYLNITNPFDVDNHILQYDEIQKLNVMSEIRDLEYMKDNMSEDYKKKYGDYSEKSLRNILSYMKNRNYIPFVAEKANEIRKNLYDNLKSLGYDGITHIGGGYMGDREHKVYIAFDSNQIKSVDNLNPTSDADIRYSLKENKFISNLSSSLGISKYADKQGLKNLVSELSEDFKNNNIDTEKIDNLFEKIFKEAIITDDEFYNEYKDLKREIKNTRLYVSDKVKSEFPEYEDFRKSNFGKLTLTSDSSDSQIDSYYQELAEKYPQFFPEDVDNTQDQLWLIAEVQNNIVKVDNKLTDKKAAREEFYKVLEEFRSGLKVKPQSKKVKKAISPNKKLPTKSQLTILNEAYTRLKQAEQNNEERIADVLTSTEKSKLPVKKSVENGIDATKRKFSNAAATVVKLSKITKDASLYTFYNSGRQARSSAEYMISKMQRDIDGNVVGKGLIEIFEPIRRRGDEYYEDFSRYMYNRHNIDRMSQGKPVFGKAKTAKMSQAEIIEAESKHPEYIDYANEIYDYLNNLMQYRVDTGLISEEQANMMKEMYPNYVPTYRDKQGTAGAKTKGNTVEINTGVKSATGGDADLLPLHLQIARQTMQTVQAGKRNIFGNRLLSDAITFKNSLGEYIQSIQTEKADIEETQKEFDHEEMPELKNSFVVYNNGERTVMKLNDGMYEAVKAISSESREMIWIEKGFKSWMRTFKRLVTGWNPIFMAKNPIRDIQEVVLYSKDLTAFVKAYPKAIKEILTDGELWNKYQSLGGFGSSVFDYEKGYKERKHWFTKGMGFVGDKIEGMNFAVEQLPRFTEFYATLEKGDGSYENLMEAMYNAADITANFGEVGSWGKVLNETAVPFFNPSVKGFEKFARLFTETKGAKNWLKLIAKASILGIPPLILNEMLFDDDDEYEKITNRDKDIYYLFKIKEDLWIKIPKGRASALFGNAAQRTYRYVKGDENAWAGFINTAIDNNLPVNPVTNNIAAPLILAANNKTWYGTPIESQSLQNFKPSERYDEKTDSFSIMLGKWLNYSPKKINYMLDAYTGVIGDFVLPLMTKKAETGPIKKAFTIDSTLSNKIGENFYNALEELTYDKNSVDEFNVHDVNYRYMYKQSKAVNDLNKEIKTIEKSNISDKEKQVKVKEIKAIINGIQQNALDNLDKYKSTSNKNFNKYKALYDDLEDVVDYAYLYTNKELFGAEYALQVYNKKIYEKYLKQNDMSADEYFKWYFEQLEVKREERKEAEEKKESKSKLPTIETKTVSKVKINLPTIK